MIHLGDKAKPLTAEDLIRRYNLDSLKNDRNKIVSMQTALNKQFTIIKNFIRCVTPYKNQTDKMSVWFFNGTPTLDNEPFKNLTNAEKANSHIYYDKQNGTVYQLVFSEDTYSWSIITDEDLTQSLAVANREVDTGEGCRNVFFNTPTIPYSIGDMWIDEETIKRCRHEKITGSFDESNWSTIEDYDNNLVSNDTKASLEQFKSEVANTYATKEELEEIRTLINGLHNIT